MQVRRRLAVLGALLATATLGGPPPAHAEFAEDFHLVGHRGFPGPGVTENTLAAFERARRHGVDGVELDVRITRDGRFVVMHDDSLRRTTTCDGGATVSGSTLAWIRTRCRGQAGGERIPSLAVALDWFEGNRLEPVVELKARGWTVDRIRALRTMLRARGLGERALLLSFNTPALRTVEAVAPRLATQSIALSWRDLRRKRSADTAENRLDGFNVFAADLSRDRVDRLRRQGYLVLGRNTNRESDWRRLRAVGVDGLLVDRVVAFQKWRAGGG